MWTDHPHVPALERDWLLYVEKQLAVPFLSIIILLLVTRNRTLNTSPRGVKWHRSLSNVNQCVCVCVSQTLFQREVNFWFLDSQ